jgi:hypothetical protein
MDAEGKGVGARLEEVLDREAVLAGSFGGGEEKREGKESDDARKEGGRG